MPHGERNQRGIIMPHVQPSRLQLADDQVARLDRPCNLRLEVTRGQLWVTVDGDHGDIVLGPGESFVVDSAGPVLVSALLGDASVELHPDAGRPVCRRAGATRLVHRPSRLEQLFAGITLSSAAVA